MDFIFFQCGQAQILLFLKCRQHMNIIYWRMHLKGNNYQDPRRSNYCFAYPDHTLEYIYFHSFGILYTGMMGDTFTFLLVSTPRRWLIGKGKNQKSLQTAVFYIVYANSTKHPIFDSFFSSFFNFPNHWKAHSGLSL